MSSSTKVSLITFFVLSAATFLTGLILPAKKAYMQQYKEESRFEIVKEEFLFLSNKNNLRASIVKDKYTGEEYLFIEGYQTGGLTKLEKGGKNE